MAELSQKNFSLDGLKKWNYGKVGNTIYKKKKKKGYCG